MRNWFKTEWVWRLFVVLQISGVIVLVVLDLSAGYWDLLPSKGYGGMSWDLFESHYWKLNLRGEDSYNWLAIIFVFGPFVMSKSIDWILAGRDEKD